MLIAAAIALLLLGSVLAAVGEAQVATLYPTANAHQLRTLPLDELWFDRFPVTEPPQ